ncbi:uncharacterized protein AMSG_09160 [Thecamonas trahens ATCC 50062]|uniref:NADH dehydrogenase [ubiquinone] 1 beta subcomplex subunit 11, mitochondrial n=1 Tax=Thecamonas trahens ATCC 50062 TaxID=461836 RepID=A0A0L0DKT3_THETB|nr:hypothetical protein AMSG_09160 [Thecamonas trahens ATCC 50062]KNC52984.1 hypothetical protein AMSG_09160 [Thecamonas trahens ATCC 50062]|eukprot:XP_013754873.1 hypothetical protein AMSG_09160 [Thecamonas trahens ATCC 50062]
MLRAAAGRVSAPLRRLVHSSAPRRGGATEEIFSDTQNGYLFGEKPGVPRKKELWETMMQIGMGGTFVLAAIGLACAPETSIKVWAEEESVARIKRRQAEE